MANSLGKGPIPNLGHFGARPKGQGNRSPPEPPCWPSNNSEYPFALNLLLYPSSLLPFPLCQPSRLVIPADLFCPKICWTEEITRERKEDKSEGIGRRRKKAIGIGGGQWPIIDLWSLDLPRKMDFCQRIG